MQLDDLFPDGPPEGLDWDALREIFGDRDLDEMSAADIRYPAPEEISARLQSLTAIVEAGEEAQRQRAAVMRLARAADSRRWTQQHLAEVAGVSQAAVSKALAAAPRPPAGLRAAYLAGRLVAVAENAPPDRAKGKAARLAGKMLSGAWPVNATSTATLARLARQDIGARRRTWSPRQAEMLDGAVAEITALLSDATDGNPIVMTVDNQADMFAGYHAQRRELKEAGISL